MAEGLVGREQPQDNAEAFVHFVALRHRIDAEHDGVRRQRAGPDPEHRASVTQMVEHHDSLCDVERMMVRNRDDAGAELDSLGALGRGDQEHFRRRDRLPSRRMMLADPELVVVKLIEQFGEFEIALKLERRMLADRMMWREKHAKAESLCHFLFETPTDGTVE